MKALSFLEISKAAILSNISVFKKKLPPQVTLTAVIKANAYGHGIEEFIKIAGKSVDAFQVDDIEEVRLVRKYTKKPVFVFGYVRKSDLKEIVSLNATVGVSSLETINELNSIGQRFSKKIKIHLKIDALLGRQGIMPKDAEIFGQSIKAKKFIELEAVYSHFSDIEDSESLDHARSQHKELMAAKGALIKMGFMGLKHHISATSGFLSDIEANWGGAMVRLGLGMYGLWPSKSIEKKFSRLLPLRPAIRWVSHLAQVKEVPKGFPIGYGRTFIATKKMKIGIVPQGYSDGFDRGFSNNGHVLVKGHKCKVIGRVAMNMFAIDLSGISKEKIEDEVVLLGKQGNKSIWAEELADRISTINYEVIARISPLLPRFIK